MPLNSGAGRRHRPSQRTLEIEGLESRLLLYATLGGGWSFGQRITYSFAPDGTDAGSPNQMNQRMNELGLSNSWRNEIRRAAALWAAATNINLVEVADSGAPFGVNGNQQNDSRFGDIRIAGIPMASGTLASAFLPPPFNGGTLAGDIVFNTNIAWKVGSTYDLQTVAAHEFGHALGLDHTNVTTAQMFANYNGLKQSLSTDDIAGIQSVYGTRQVDLFDQGAGNNSFSTSTSLAPFLNASGQISVSGLDITTSSDQDWFTVVAPANATGTMTVTMQSSQLSSLSPRFFVYNGALQLAGWNSAPNTYGSTITATFSGVVPGTRVYVRAMSANTGPTGVGSYGLQVNFSNQAMAAIAPPDTTVAATGDQGGGSIAQRGVSDTFEVDPSLKKTVRTILKAGRDVASWGPGQTNWAFPSMPRASDPWADAWSMAGLGAVGFPDVVSKVVSVVMSNADDSGRPELVASAVDSVLDRWLNVG